MKDAAPLLFDTHVHLDAASFAESLDSEVRCARQAGVGGFVVPGVDRTGWRRILGVARTVAGAWAAPGLHPLAAGEWCLACERDLQQLLDEPQVIAIGEIGLDTLLPSPSQAEQEPVLRAQLRLAIAADLPVLIHCRRATGRLLEILREEEARRVGGIFHAFSGSIETALQGIRLGFAIGVGGTVTYPEARRLPEVVQKLPAEWLVLETDAPDIPPAWAQGRRNVPANLARYAALLARLRGISVDEVVDTTGRNVCEVLGGWRPG